MDTHKVGDALCRLGYIKFPLEERVHTLGIISGIIDPDSLYIEIIYCVDWCDGSRGKYLQHEISEFKDFLNTYQHLQKLKK